MKAHSRSSLVSLAALSDELEANGVASAIVVGSSPRAPSLLDGLAIEPAHPTLLIGLNAGLRLAVDRVRKAPEWANWYVWSVVCDWRAPANLGAELEDSLDPMVVRL